MKKTNLRAFACLLAVMLCMAAFSMTALAYGGEESDGNPGTNIVIDTETPSIPDPKDGSETKIEISYEDLPASIGDFLSAFTPEGNLTLIDDFSRAIRNEDGELEMKQFLTVQSKAGNTFYIVIDRAGDTENVYFLNLVDEVDLFALTDAEAPSDTGQKIIPTCTCKEKCKVGHVDTACPVCATDMTKCTGKEAQPEPTEPPEEPEPQTPDKKGGGNIALVILLLLAGGGGAAYYFLKVKGKANPQTKGNDDLDDYDYGAEDGDEYEFEPYDPEAGGGAPGEAEDEDS